MLKGGLIGCGFFAVNHMHGWDMAQGADIVAICDRDPARLAAVGDAFGISARYSDAALMLAEQDLDFVDIATTVPSHSLVSKDSFAPGCSSSYWCSLYCRPHLSQRQAPDARCHSGSSFW